MRSGFRGPSDAEAKCWIAISGPAGRAAIWSGECLKRLGIAPVLLDWFTNFLRVLLLAPLPISNPGRARAAMKGYRGLALGVGELSPLSYIFVLAALSLGAPLSVVAPMREMSMMVGALMAMVILREKVGPGRLIGCTVRIAGVILLSSA